MGIRRLKSDAKGNMFIGTLGKGLMIKQPGDTIAMQLPVRIGGRLKTDYDVQSLKQDYKGNIWILIAEVGLARLNWSKMQIDLIDTSIKNGFCIEPDKDNVWIGRAEGLYLYEGNQKRTLKVADIENGNLSDHLISDIITDEKNNLWLAINGRGIAFYNKSTGIFNFLKNSNGKNPLSNDNAYTIFNDRDGRKWIGLLNGGINIINSQEDRFQSITNDPSNSLSLPKNSIYAMHEDSKGQLWIGTEGAGVAIWNRKLNKFNFARTEAGNNNAISDNVITNIIEDDSKNIWIGTFFGGINKFNNLTGKFEHYQCINPISHLESLVISALCIDKQKNIWAGTLKGGGTSGALYLFNQQQNQFIAFDTRLSDLVSLFPDNYGKLWAGIQTQLVDIDLKEKRHRYFNLGSYIRCIFEDRSHNFWIGTEGGGLVLFDRHQSKILARYTVDSGLCNNSVLNILEDNDGNLWLSTFSGISKFNPKNQVFKNYYKSDGLQSNQFHYNSSIKLKSGELVFGGINGLNIFFPDKIKIIYSHPELILSKILINNTPIEDEISHVKEISNNSIKKIEIPYNKNVLSFDFTALEYSAPDKIKYCYYMDGWDREWSYPSSNRSANYTHLNEGSYTFRVRCTNAEGKWMAQELTLKIRVLPPWYRSWYMYLIYLIIGIALVYLYLNYKTRQTRIKYEMAMANANIEKEKAEHEKERAERERIEAEIELERAEFEKERAERERVEAEIGLERAEFEKERMMNEKENELNDKRMSFFTNIAHEFRTPLTLIINPAKSMMEKQTSNVNEVSVIYRNARRMLNLIDQLLHFRKLEGQSKQVSPGKLNFYDLCLDVFQYFTQEAAAKNIKFDFICNNTEIELYVDRIKLEIVLSNLISNALKHTPQEGRVQFCIEETDSTVIIKITDTGYGINSLEGDNIFEKFYQAEDGHGIVKPGFGIGLYIVKQFIELHMGSVSYTSNLGEGTTFTVNLPKGDEHFEVNSNYKNRIIAEIFDEQLLNKRLIVIDPNTEQNLVEENEFISDRKTMLIADDDKELKEYLANLFKNKFIIYQAENGDQAILLAQKHLPDIIISDIKMGGKSGIEVCKTIKSNRATAHIPVILLTGTSSPNLRLESAEGGADDYIIKPFENAYLQARVESLLNSRTNLQTYFYNRVTHQDNELIKISSDYKEFIEKCILIVERHLNDPEFNVNHLLNEIGMSHSNLYRRVKSVSGVSVTLFIRFIRLRKAAELMIKNS